MLRRLVTLIPALTLVLSCAPAPPPPDPLDNGLMLAVATHDQGVVAVVKPSGDGWEVMEIDSEPNTFVHEIEVGDRIPPPIAAGCTSVQVGNPQVVGL
jgi:hypothetical protein